MKPASRGKSNSKQPLPSQKLEMETKMMEEKLALLKVQMEIEKKKKEEKMVTSGSRWTSSSTAQPIKNYANVVMQAKKESDQAQKIDYAKMNKEYGQAMAQKQAMKKTSGSSTSISGRPGSAQLLNETNKTNQKQVTTNSTHINTTPHKSKERPPSSSEKRPSLGISIQNKLRIHAELKKILEDMNLIQFEEVFTKHGFCTLESLEKLDKDIMTEIGIPPGFQIKLLKRIQPILPQKQPEEYSNQNEEQKKQYPTRTTPKQQLKVFDQSSQVESSQKKENDSKAINQLENKVPLKIPKPLGRPPLKRKNSKEVGLTQPTEVKGKQQEKVNSNSGFTGTAVQTPEEFMNQKTSCWTCFQLINKEEIISLHNKTFCSEECLESFENTEQVKCKKCNSRVSIKQAIKIANGNWNCAQACQKLQEEDKRQEGDQQFEDEGNEEEYCQKKIREYEELDRQRKEDKKRDKSKETQKSTKILNLQELEKKYKFAQE